MDQKVIVDFVSQVDLVVLTGDIAQGRQHQRTCGQALLAIDQVEARVLARLGQARHEYQKAHEVIAGLSRRLDV